ncbi:MAG: hypothetical protein LBS55_03535 [Prevotellaceae bacterium]|jgi:hypothetical protein|nr:hypothetical protein [Prevotellaceae bacterium]
MDKTDINEFLENAHKKERTLKRVPPSMPQRRQYDERLVAWFDVLGMRSKIRAYKEHDAEEILTIMGRFQNYVRNSCETLEELGQVKYMQLSDGFILVSEFDCLNKICEILCQIQWKILVNDNMLLRGALTSGKISMTDDDPRLIVGPAFVEAYHMESENAIFPRIIISHDLYQSIKFDFITEDSDHFYFLDFLEYVIKNEDYNIKQLTQNLRTFKVIEFLKTEYNKHIENDIKVAQKYGWMIEKLSARKIAVL